MPQANQIDRRKALALVAAAPAAITLAGATAAAASSDLARLLEDHRVAYRAFCDAIDREQEMSSAHKDAYKDTIIVPCLLGGGFSLAQGREFCEEHIAAAYFNQRDRLKQLSRVAPELAEQVRSVMDAKEVENTELMDRMFAEEDARQEARLKAEYLAEAPGLRDGLQEEQVKELLQSFSEIA